jgi:biotin transport system substrate-specific component
MDDGSGNAAGAGAAASARSEARRTATTALLAALLAGSVFFTVPVAPVPFTMQVFVVVLIALIVPPRWAALSVGTYLVLGAVGLPVFAGFRGGLHVLVGPTGGFLLGFLVAAPVGSWVRQRLDGPFDDVVADSAAAAAVIGIVYLLGWAQLALVTRMGALPAVLVGVLPYIVPDVIKAIAAVVVAGGVRRVVRV